MPACDYCDRGFEDENAYLDHLADQHYDELGRIDERRVQQTINADKRSSLKMLGAGAAGAALLFGGGAYAVTSITGDDVGESEELTPKESLTEDFRHNHLHGIAYDHDDQRLYLASHYGLFVLRDDDLYLVGDSLDDHMGFTMHPEDPSILYRSGHPKDGGNLGVEYSEDGGMTWERIFTGIGDETVDFHSMTISDADPDVLLGAYAGALYVTEDAGENWRVADGEGLPEEGPSWGVPALAADMDDRTTVFAGTYEGLFESTDLGDTWDRRTSGAFTAITIHPTDAAIRYGFTEEGIVRSDDDGDTWSVLYPASEFESDEYVFGIAVNRGAPEEVYAATTANRVLHSMDGGEQWTELLNE